MWQSTQIEVARALQAFLELKELPEFEIPSRLSHGHVAYPLFKYAKLKKQAPPVLAGQAVEYVEGLGLEGVQKVFSVAGFVNIVFEASFLKEKMFSVVQEGLASYLQNSVCGAREKIVIDFSSPNVAKPMHVGHLRATVIGQALCNLAKTLGHEVIGLNHIGDWGVQFGRVALAYEMWGQEYDFEKEPFESLYKLYVRIHAEKDEELVKKGSLYFKRLEEGDEELKKLWSFFVQISLDSYNQLYKRLGTHHDLVRGESFYNDRIQVVVDSLKKKNLLELSDGAFVVRVGEDIPPCLILKNDGASLYATRDLASLFYRFNELKVDRNIYVTGADQSLHFRQVFEVGGRLHPSWKEKSQHVSFGLYQFQDEKMSSRKGNVITLQDLLETAKGKVEEIIAERRDTLSCPEDVAEQVAVGAIIFNDLINDRVQNVDFDWERVLSFHSAGPYVQYVYVRCLRLLEKSSVEPDLTLQGLDFCSESEEELIKHLLSFERSIQSAFDKLKPHVLATYLLELCQKFNHFYSQVSILNAESPDLVKQRVTLVFCVRSVLIECMKVLGLPRPKEM